MNGVDDMGLKIKTKLFQFFKKYNTAPPPPKISNGSDDYFNTYHTVIHAFGNAHGNEILSILDYW